MEVLISVAGILVVVGIYNAYVRVKERKKQQEERERLDKLEEEYENLIKLEQEDEELKKHLAHIINFFQDLNGIQRRYFAHSQCELLKEQYKDTYNYLLNKRLLCTYDKLDKFLGLYPNLNRYRKEFNKDFVKKQLIDSDKLLSNIDGKSLDLQQRDAVVIDEDNNLVVAGAGSGKTLTIAGKVAYLVNKMEIKPEDILLITFTKKASDEMEERVIQKLGVPVKVSTFHALGLGIIAQGTGKKPSIEDNPDKILDVYFKSEILKDMRVMRDFVTFFGNYLNVPKEIAEFKDYGQYLSAQKHISLDTLKGICQSRQVPDKITILNERVKSIEELNIANFLFLSGVKYEYEMEYEYDTSSQQYRQYKPDFYLPEYGIYIEHFGVDRRMYASQLPDIEARKYREGMEWKRSLHRQNGTTLYETYSYQFKEGNILEVLKQDLSKMGVKFNSLNKEEIEKCIAELIESRTFGEFRKLIGTFLGLFKSNGYIEVDIDRMLDENKTEDMRFLKQRNELFLAIFRDIFNYYEDYLKSKKRIDFNDMINEATTLVQEDRVAHTYKYIIIDEYQDISQSRFKLINAIKGKTGARVMAVGDDWQSIYRFAGSDIMLFTQFEKMFGTSELLKIEKTYRNSQQLIDLAGNFVMQNPLQLNKQLKSGKSLDIPVAILGYNTSLEYAVLVTLRRLAKDDEKKTILLLGRNNFDIKLLEESVYFDIKTTSENTKIKCAVYPNLDITFMTVHRSKGLEADEVIVINCKNDLVGFPNQISDDLVLNFVLTQGDNYLYGEERRLWYVALTRTKNRCILLTPSQKPSIFVEELIEDYAIPFKEIEESTEYSMEVRCPRCKSGLLVKRGASDGRQFLGCNNYPGCDYTFKDISLLENAVKCPKCEGYMTKRKGKFGEFYGCSNYPLCDGTKQIEEVEIMQSKEVKVEKGNVASEKNKYSVTPQILANKFFYDNEINTSFVNNEIRGLYEEFREPK